MLNNIQKSNDYNQNSKDSKYTFNHPENIQIIETTAGGDAVIHKYAPAEQRPDLVEDAKKFLHLLEQSLQNNPNTTEAQKQGIVKASVNKTIENFKHIYPTSWRRFHKAGGTLLREKFKAICNRPWVDVIVETIDAYFESEDEEL